MEFNPEIGLDSYDRFFPNQDTLPRGGFGNLIALPLQKLARNQGNSVFIDENLQIISIRTEKYTYTDIKNYARIASSRLTGVMHVKT